MIYIKKIFIILTLTLIIILSSFISVFAGNIQATINSFGTQYNLDDLTVVAPEYRIFIYDQYGSEISNIGGNFISNVKFTINYDGSFEWLYGEQEYSMFNYGSSTPLTSNSFPITLRQFTWGNEPYEADIQTISIKPMQRVVFNYLPQYSDTFLKSISATEKKGIVCSMGYMIGKEINELTIRKDTTDKLYMPDTMELNDFPIPRDLNTNEYLTYTQANGGNWVWTDLLGGNGSALSTDANSLVNFTVDLRQCTYKILSANTGLVINTGGNLDAMPIDEADLYNNNDNPWGPGDITDDYMVDRADYSNDLMGAIQFGFDNLFKFIKMPFEILYKFILTLGEIVTYAVGSIGGLMGALTGVYGVLPTAISYLFTMAISIQIFKLIFGR